MDPVQNPLMAGPKKKPAKKPKAKKDKDMLVKDLFGDIGDPMNDQNDMDQDGSESDEGDFEGQDESFRMADNLASGLFDGGTQ